MADRATIQKRRKEAVVKKLFPKQVKKSTTVVSKELVPSDTYKIESELSD